MKFAQNGPSIPDVLLDRCDAGRVVFLCGAGVSVPSKMPTFVELTEYVIDSLAPPPDSEIMHAFRPWLKESSAANVPLDQIFNLLHQEYGRNEINSLVTQRLRVEAPSKVAGNEHRLIKRISSTSTGVPQIVTTNFDRLFELGPSHEALPRHLPPTFPDLTFGSSIAGITYLHGSLADAGSDSHDYVLSSADFGRAYLSQGWATSFMRSLLQRYTVVLLGYQAEDPPIKYLLQGLNHDGKYDRSRLYAFDRGLPEVVEAKWRDRGVTAIAYSDHPELWQTLALWADRADEPRRWRNSVISSCQSDPKSLSPHERGQVKHVLRTVQGARLFSELEPKPHPEWICVLDAAVRTGKPSKSYGEDPERFDPFQVYRVDDDLPNITDEERRQGVTNDHLLNWRDGDENPHENHRLDGRQVEGHEALPPRLGHLITWIGKSLDSPALAWWAIRKNGLHPRLLRHIEWKVNGDRALDVRARHIWNMIIEYQSDPRNRHFHGDWFDLRKRIASDGWSESVLRKFRQVVTPCLELKPPFGLGAAKPPASAWSDIRLGDLGQFDVKFLARHNEKLDIPDAVFPRIFSILQEQFVLASGLLEDVETVYFKTPTCYPSRDVDGDEDETSAADAFGWFRRLFDRLADLRPDLAKAHATTWDSKDPYFFRKLKLYAYGKTHVFEADEAAELVLSLDQQSFWDLDVARELLFLLSDRWLEFSDEMRAMLIARIFTGPDRRPHWPDEDYPSFRSQLTARYGRYLELKGCFLNAEHHKRLDEIIQGIPDWSDGWATSTVTEQGSPQIYHVGVDETPDQIKDLPIDKIVPVAKEELRREFGSFTEKRPFTGLVKNHPRRALSALTIAARENDYPKALWASMINDLPKDVSPRLQRLFLRRITRLPHEVIVELRHTLCRWLEQNLSDVLVLDDDLGWAVFDHIVDGTISGGSEAAQSGMGEIRLAGEVIERSRRTLDHAINGPLGMCAEALFNAVPGETQEKGSLVPDHIKTRLERLFAAPGEGSDHAVAVACQRLNWFMFIDPEWTKRRLIPLLAFDHPAAEPAWNGFLHSGHVPRDSLAELIRPLLVDIFPWMEGFSWDRDLAKIAAEWLGWMRIFQPDAAAGLTRLEMRSALRSMSDSTRNRFIFWLGRVGQKNENGWSELVVPFIENEWPLERQFRTTASVRAWINLLDDTGDSFPVVYSAVRKFLVPVETNDHPFYRFTRDISEEKPITVQHPETTLDLMDKVTPDKLMRPSYELPKILALIAETDPTLTSDARFLRLIDLVERS